MNRIRFTEIYSNAININDKSPLQQKAITRESDKEKPKKNLVLPFRGSFNATNQ